MGIMETIDALIREEGEKLSERRGEKRGEKRGKLEGELRGKEIEVENLITKLGLSDEQAADVAEVSVEFVANIRAKLAK